MINNIYVLVISKDRISLLRKVDWIWYFDFWTISDDTFYFDFRTPDWKDYGYDRIDSFNSIWYIYMENEDITIKIELMEWNTITKWDTLWIKKMYQEKWEIT